MINSPKLLNDLRKTLATLEDDIRSRSRETPEIDARLQEQYKLARAADRTAATFVEWRDEQVTQAAVAWILGCVFVRFMEDNGLVAEAWLAGPGERLSLARDQHTHYFQQRPKDTDRDYLLFVFTSIRTLPAVAELFDERHNPIWQLPPSGDGAALLLQFFQKIDAEQGGLAHDFADPAWNTRFLGDLYQDLSESARKKYALLQTPEFVEEFILDRTLNPAIDTFGLKEIRMIDPTCGSGHFVLGGFRRILDRWQRLEPATNTRELVQRALKSVCGVDINPFAVAIARFRLLVAALEACSIKRLKDAPNFHFNLAVGDSLLHGSRPGDEAARQLFLGGDKTLSDPLKHVYETEDRELLRTLLGQRYHAVVGNPPYITVKDKVLNQAYRDRFGSCHRKYSLAVPFMERFFDLAAEANIDIGSPAGYVGMITSNSFMKREFGKKLIEQFMPRWDVTHVIDTAGAYIPGHGTPTVILFGKHQRPTAPTIRAVMGIKGEPSTPSDPSKGLVWSAILHQVDCAGSDSDFVSVADTERSSFHSHPWSIGGGGAAELKLYIDDNVEQKLGEIVDNIGIGAVTAEDDAFVFPKGVLKRQRISESDIIPFVQGDNIKNWHCSEVLEAIFPYNRNTFAPTLHSSTLAFLWPVRQVLRNRIWFRKTQDQRGLHWFEYGYLSKNQAASSRCIAFAFVSSHNNFVFLRDLRILNRSSPAIRLGVKVSNEEYLGVLSVLCSSTACFWMKQIFFPKGGDQVGQSGARIRKTLWDERYEYDTAKLDMFPVVHDTPKTIGATIDHLMKRAELCEPRSVLSVPPLTEMAKKLSAAEYEWHISGQQLIAIQEELDWACYRLYCIVEIDLCCCAKDVPPINLGERAFEIVMARQMAAGELETTWFERHGSKPITEIPSHWPESYRQIVQRRIETIKTSRDIALIEKPEYKRRWNVESWDDQLRQALQEWLLDRLEDPCHWPVVELTSAARLADRLRQDAEFMQVAELYRGRPDFDVVALVSELALSEGVPALPIWRYKPSGLRKREAWEQVWELQRKEDAIDAELGVDAPDLSEAERHLRKEEAKRVKKEKIGDIPVPPKYGSADFKETSFWRLRGKLDVPKERFVLFPGCERDADTTPVLAWAGWNHLQLAQAIAGYHEQVRNEGWSEARRLPLLACVQELVPWLKQWHNEIDPTYSVGLGDFFEDFVKTEARTMNKTVEEVRSWVP